MSQDEQSPAPLIRGGDQSDLPLFLLTALWTHTDHKLGAEYGIGTRDLNLGKVAFYR